MSTYTQLSPNGVILHDVGGIPACPELGVGLTGSPSGVVSEGDSANVEVGVKSVDCIESEVTSLDSNVEHDVLLLKPTEDAISPGRDRMS